ncbi:hypothetical protein BESB_012940 [Besnoitia besnoiti]|uniref:Uncharacterized protein n=1 Tax=Besnoitia besnoiti TaxID=94643 RepID=A0A2A9MBB3_BESBE|nr:hypothetical protein BESB_012940 [Besnoitia besnoiti]PFH32682.1 hypothetical protein BESB_012940 [Besnoitia besnoiti]
MSPSARHPNPSRGANAEVDAVSATMPRPTPTSAFVRSVVGSSGPFPSLSAAASAAPTSSRAASSASRPSSSPALSPRSGRRAASRASSASPAAPPSAVAFARQIAAAAIGSSLRRAPSEVVPPPAEDADFLSSRLGFAPRSFRERLLGLQPPRRAEVNGRSADDAPRRSVFAPLFFPQGGNPRRAVQQRREASLRGRASRSCWEPEDDDGGMLITRSNPLPGMRHFSEIPPPAVGSLRCSAEASPSQAVSASTAAPVGGSSRTVPATEAERAETGSSRGDAVAAPGRDEDGEEAAAATSQSSASLPPGASSASQGGSSSESEDAVAAAVRVATEVFESRFASAPRSSSSRALSPLHARVFADHPGAESLLGGAAVPPRLFLTSWLLPRAGFEGHEGPERVGGEASRVLTAEAGPPTPAPALPLSSPPPAFSVPSFASLLSRSSASVPTAPPPASAAPPLADASAARPSAQAPVAGVSPASPRSASASAAPTSAAPSPPAPQAFTPARVSISLSLPPEAFTFLPSMFSSIAVSLSSPAAGTSAPRSGGAPPPPISATQPASGAAAPPQAPAASAAVSVGRLDRQLLMRQSELILFLRLHGLGGRDRDASVGFAFPSTAEGLENLQRRSSAIASATARLAQALSRANESRQGTGVRAALGAAAATAAGDDSGAAAAVRPAPGLRSPETAAGRLEATSAESARASPREVERSNVPDLKAPAGRASRRLNFVPAEIAVVNAKRQQRTLDMLSQDYLLIALHAAFLSLHWRVPSRFPQLLLSVPPRDAEPSEVATDAPGGRKLSAADAGRLAAGAGEQGDPRKARQGAEEAKKATTESGGGRGDGKPAGGCGAHAVTCAPCGATPSAQSSSSVASQAQTSLRSADPPEGGGSTEVGAAPERAAASADCSVSRSSGSSAARRRVAESYFLRTAAGEFVPVSAAAFRALKQQEEDSEASALAVEAPGSGAAAAERGWPCALLPPAKRRCFVCRGRLEECSCARFSPRHVLLANDEPTLALTLLLLLEASPTRSLTMAEVDSVLFLPRGVIRCGADEANQGEAFCSVFPLSTDDVGSAGLPRTEPKKRKTTASHLASVSFTSPPAASSSSSSSLAESYAAADVSFLRDHFRAVPDPELAHAAATIANLDRLRRRGKIDAGFVAVSEDRVRLICENRELLRRKLEAHFGVSLAPLLSRPASEASGGPRRGTGNRREDLGGARAGGAAPGSQRTAETPADGARTAEASGEPRAKETPDAEPSDALKVGHTRDRPGVCCAGGDARERERRPKKRSRECVEPDADRDISGTRRSGPGHDGKTRQRGECKGDDAAGPEARDGKPAVRAVSRVGHGRDELGAERLVVEIPSADGAAAERKRKRKGAREEERRKKRGKLSETPEPGDFAKLAGDAPLRAAVPAPPCDDAASCTSSPLSASSSLSVTSSVSSAPVTPFFAFGLRNALRQARRSLSRHLVHFSSAASSSPADASSPVSSSSSPLPAASASPLVSSASPWSARLPGSEPRRSPAKRRLPAAGAGYSSPPGKALQRDGGAATHTNRPCGFSVGSAFAALSRSPSPPEDLTCAPDAASVKPTAAAGAQSDSTACAFASAEARVGGMSPPRLAASHEVGIEHLAPFLERKRCPSLTVLDRGNISIAILPKYLHDHLLGAAPAGEDTAARGSRDNFKTANSCEYSSVSDEAKDGDPDERQGDRSAETAPAASRGPSGSSATAALSSPEAGRPASSAAPAGQLGSSAAAAPLASSSSASSSASALLAFSTRAAESLLRGAVGHFLGTSAGRALSASPHAVAASSLSPLTSAGATAGPPPSVCAARSCPSTGRRRPAAAQETEDDATEGSATGGDAATAQGDEERPGDGAPAREDGTVTRRSRAGRWWFVGGRRRGEATEAEARDREQPGRDGDGSDMARRLRDLDSQDSPSQRSGADRLHTLLESLMADVWGRGATAEDTGGGRPFGREGRAGALRQAGDRREPAEREATDVDDGAATTTTHQTDDATSADRGRQRGLTPHASRRGALSPDGLAGSEDLEAQAEGEFTFSDASDAFAGEGTSSETDSDAGDLDEDEVEGREEPWEFPWTPDGSVSAGGDSEESGEDAPSEEDAPNGFGDDEDAFEEPEDEGGTNM